MVNLINSIKKQSSAKPVRSQQDGQASEKQGPLRALLFDGPRAPSGPLPSAQRRRRRRTFLNAVPFRVPALEILDKASDWLVWGMCHLCGHGWVLGCEPQENLRMGGQELLWE